MTAKQYLNQLHELDMKIDQDIAELSDLETKMMSVGSIDYSKDRVQTSPESEAQYARLVEKITDIQDAINQEVNEFVDRKKFIIGQIRGLDNRIYADLLFKRYVEYKDFETIRKEMDYSYSTVTHAHGDALIEFENRYNL